MTSFAGDQAGDAGEVSDPGDSGGQRAAAAQLRGSFYGPSITNHNSMGTGL